MESVIKWQTSEPNEKGTYLITTVRGIVAFDRWLTERHCFIDDDNECGWDYYKEVAAWCKLSDIKPYKEEAK